MVPASVALWNWGDAPRDASGQRTDLYCWRYNTFGFSCWRDSLNGDWSSGVEAAEADPGIYLLGLRAVRSVSYRLILLSLPWSTPVLLCFCDTVQIYNFVAAIFSAARALHLRIYYATTWAATLRHLATTAYLFNLNLLGLPMDEHYAVAPLKEDEGTRGLDGGAAREPRRREWLRFSQAWNAIVLTLRRSDLLSDKERDMLLFHTLSGAEARDFLQVTGCHCHYPATSSSTAASTTQPPPSPLQLEPGETYTLYPAMLTSPCFSAAACQQGGASYPSMGRALLQARDLTVWMARALGMVQTANMPKLVQLLTELGELERDEWRYTGFGASRHLLALRAAFARVVSAAWEFYEVAANPTLRDELRAKRAGTERIERLRQTAAEVAAAVDAILKTLLGPNESTAARPEEARMAAYKARKSKVTHKSSLTTGGASGGLPLIKRKSSLLGSLAATPRSDNNNSGPLPRQFHIDERARISSELNDVLNPSALRNSQNVNWVALRVSADTGAALSALKCAFATTNPGGEPANAEAKRQLLFFANSLHNRRLAPPPPVAQMRTWSAFTPHYAEDVTY